MLCMVLLSLCALLAPPGLGSWKLLGNLESSCRRTSPSKLKRDKARAEAHHTPGSSATECVAPGHKLSPPVDHDSHCKAQDWLSSWVQEVSALSVSKVLSPMFRTTPPDTVKPGSRNRDMFPLPSVFDSIHAEEPLLEVDLGVASSLAASEASMHCLVCLLPRAICFRMQPSGLL